MKTRAIGILGGTFDPIHAGHLALADAACRALELDRVLFVPSNIPPHRPADTLASPFHRFAMVALATASDARYLASDAELRQPGPSYTADTLRRMIADGYLASQLFFIAGADAFAEIATWKGFPAILDLAQFVVCSRPGHSALEIPRRLPGMVSRMLDASRRRGDAGADETARIWLVDAKTPMVSSTGVRSLAESGQRIGGLVPPEVESYIFRHGLYGVTNPSGGPSAPAAVNLHE